MKIMRYSAELPPGATNRTLSSSMPMLENFLGVTSLVLSNTKVTTIPELPHTLHTLDLRKSQVPKDNPAVSRALSEE